MAKVRLSANAEIDLLNKGELQDSLSAQAAADLTARGAGVKHFTFRQSALAAISTTAGFVVPFTPNVGYVWSLRFVSAYLSSAQTISYFLVADTNATVLPNNNAAALGSNVSGVLGSLTFGKGNVLMDPEQYVVIAAGGSATLNSYMMQVWEVPTEQQWKIS